MKILITGATGMVGKAVLIEALDNDSISEVVLINRSRINITNKKITEVIHNDFSDFSAIANSFNDIDACIYCMGTTGFGKSEAQYTEITYNFAYALASQLYKYSPQAICFYVSGANTDSSENGRTMWARVKGKTENMFMDMGFNDAYAIRPGAIYPRKGVKSKTWLYTLAYTFLLPVAPIVKRFVPMVDSDALANIILNLITQPYERKHIEIADFAKLKNGDRK